LIVWKDAFRQKGRRFTEASILGKIHGSNPVPGVVQFNAALSGDIKPVSDVDNYIETPRRSLDHHEHSQWIKTRLIMESTGEELYKCETVRDALKVLYDVLEGEYHDVFRYIAPHNRFV
jgi:hypothetical protein